MHCKRAKYIVSLVLILLCVGAWATPAVAQSKSQLQKEKSKIEAEIKRLDKELTKAKKNTKLNASQLKALNQKIAERNKLIRNINAQLGALDAQIGRTEDSLNHMRSHVDSLKTEYAKVVRVLYREQGNLDKLALVFDTPAYNRSFLRLKYYTEYSRYRRHQATFIRQRQEELEELNQKLRQQKGEKSSLLAQEKEQKDKLTREQTQKQQSMASSQANEKQLAKQLSQKQQQKKKLEQQIQKLVAEEVAKANKQRTATNTGKTMTGTTSKPAAPSAAEEALSNDFASNKGRLSWPAYYKSVLREFGKYRHDSGGENISNGIELSTSPGAAVYCIFKGTVTRVFTCPNGTTGVIVRHGDYMTVYANLASVSVKEGAAVATKQQIGTVYAASGAATGELSFQIWKGTTPHNPRNWLR